MTHRLVAVRMPTGPGMVDVIEDCWADGDAVLPLDPAAPAATRRALLDRLRPAVELHATGPGADPAARGLEDPRPVADDTALVVPTSGSTGPPKGVELTHAALDHAARASVERLGCQPGERWLLCLPLHHVAGILVLLRSRRLGTDPVVHTGFDAAAVAAADAEHVSLVPTQLVRLLDAGADLSGLSTVLLGGGPAPGGLLARARRAGPAVVVSYGLTETCGGCVYDGRPLDGVEVAVGDGGRIAVRGPVLMRGYRSRPALTARVLRDGWLTTPDRGRLDADGRLRVLGRADDVIVTGGENVSAGAVARVLRADAAVAEAAVVGRPDDEWGERVAAVVVPADPGRPPSLEGLRDRARGALPAHALPAALTVVDRLPRDAMGKVDRDRLRRG